MKNRSVVLAGLIFLVFSPLARADLAKAGQEIKETAVEVARKTAQVGREVGRATVETAKSVGHVVADGARKGYAATRQAVRDGDAAPSPGKPPPD